MNLFKALMPMHHPIVEETGTATVSASSGADSLAALQERRELLACLQGYSQLVSVAQYDSELALTIKAGINALEDADFECAQAAFAVALQLIRTHQIEAKMDEAGVVKR